jgi:hypothetical protein
LRFVDGGLFINDELVLGDGGGCVKTTKKLELNGGVLIAFTKGDWSSGMIPVLGTGGPGFNSRIAPFFILPRKGIKVYGE